MTNAITPPVLTREQQAQARFDRMMKATLPEGWSYGYIGNVDHKTDDRAWFIFAPHPGRVGTPKDRIGGFSTEDRHKLTGLAAAIAFGRAKMAEGH